MATSGLLSALSTLMTNQVGVLQSQALSISTYKSHAKLDLRQAIQNSDEDQDMVVKSLSFINPLHWNNNASISTYFPHVPVCPNAFAKGEKGKNTRTNTKNWSSNMYSTSSPPVSTILVGAKVLSLPCQRLKHAGRELVSDQAGKHHEVLRFLKQIIRERTPCLIFILATEQYLAVTAAACNRPK